MRKRASWCRRRRCYRAEDAERRPLRAIGKPDGIPGDADGEGVPGQPERRRAEKQLQIILGMGKQVRGNGANDEQGNRDVPAAVAIRPDAEGQPRQRSGQNRNGQQPFETLLHRRFDLFRFEHRGGAAQHQGRIFLDLQTEYAEHEPDGEENGEGER